MMTLKAVGAFLSLFLLFLGVGLSAYVTKAKLDLVEVYFKDNTMMIGHCRWWGGNSFKDRSMRQGLISMMVMFPKMFIWRGFLTQQEIDVIPPTLKRWIKAPLYFEIPFFLAAIAFCIGEQFQ
ncbi:hypothetical protein [Pseudomonas gingeri]|uniref:Uncharacterized protein n=1 Tax=Pseudomonas gingeri TaxID=117681 RepID=A0A7Y7WP33_9PSED|nr:hypothetical protein [Pseudomonas gingeri]NWB84700.1 hypothetical protein [Pseudomonas gingeri]